MPRSRSDRLRLRDLRSAYRLIGECRELGRDPDAWRQHMLDGLRRLTGAQLALYLHIRHLGTADEEITEPVDAGFLDDSDRALWLHYQREKAHLDDLFHQRYYREFTGALRTRRLESVVEMAEWRRSRHYNEYIRPCRLDDRVTSSVRLPEPSDHEVQVIVLHRSAGDGQYSRRDVRLVHLFHHELVSLLGRQLAMPETCAASALPRQLRHVLARLLHGDGEKQIADSMGISPHTVNRHVQRLYRRFGVHSRGELMYCCRDMLPALVSDRALEGMQGGGRIR